jgi:deferrochelatase/peroxidase EfeB
LHFAAFDVITDSRAELVPLLKDWTAAAARMTQGLGAGELGPTSGSYAAPQDDTTLEGSGWPAAPIWWCVAST